MAASSRYEARRSLRAVVATLFAATWASVPGCTASSNPFVNTAATTLRSYMWITPSRLCVRPRGSRHSGWA